MFHTLNQINNTSKQKFMYVNLWIKSMSYDKPPWVDMASGGVDSLFCRLLHFGQGFIEFKHPWW